MQVLLVIIFIISYAAIAFEHSLKINKSASALIGAGLLWTIYSLSNNNIAGQLDESVSTTAQIVFFLMGAMTIVEVVDAHDGFDVITEKIRTTRMVTLLWSIGFVTFFLSAVLDNLTTTIVMLSLNKKLLANKNDRLFFAGIIVIAANAGGAWSPLGDVTTTMLWIGNQVTALNIIKSLFLPSLANLVVPLVVISYMLRGRSVESPSKFQNTKDRYETTKFERNFMFFGGIGLLCAVPVFKTVTNLPPFMGILFALGLLWLAGNVLHRKKDNDMKQHLKLVSALQRIDMASIVFFIGILLAVATLEHSHILAALAQWLDKVVGNQSIIVIILGVVSAIVDNVPIVAASMGMYPMAHYPTDSFLWEFLAYAVGTGGSILIIGSAAGVAAMGIEKIEFFWYLKRISLFALVGYISGAVIYIFL